MNRTKTLRSTIIKNTIVTLLIAITLFGIIAITFSVFSTITSRTERNEVLATTISQQFTTSLREPKKLLTYIESDYDFETSREFNNLNASLKNFAMTNEFILNIEIVGADGIVIYSANIPSETLGQIRTGEAFYQHYELSNVPIYWSKPYMSGSTENLTFNITKRMADGNIIVVYIDLATLSETASELSAAFDDVEISITDEFGIFISHIDNDKVKMRLFDNRIDEIKSLLDSDDTFKISEDLDGKGVVLTAAQMQDSNWYVIVSESITTVFRPVIELGFILTVVTLIVVSISIIYTLLFTRRVVRFIEIMNATMARATIPKFKVDLPSFHFSDINVLRDNFIKMHDLIQERDHKLYTMAYQDSLTGFGNRQLLSEHLSEIFRKHIIPNLTLVHVDIDDFKIINDLYGHDFGDKVLKYVSSNLSQVFNDYDGTIYRLGGDEFSILFKASLNETKIINTIRPFIDKLSQGIAFGDRVVRITLSFGISQYPLLASNASELIQNADMALYNVKGRGKSGMLTYSPTMKDVIKRKTSMDSLLRAALVEELFELHYQPQVDVKTMEIIGFEALIRLRNHNDELIPPFEFISIAEDTGLILPIGEWILKKAIADLLTLNEEFTSRFIMAINISTIQMRSKSFAQDAINIVVESSVERELIEFEITESVFIDANDDAYNTLYALEKEGISFSLDDFGTGYSSLSYLTTLPFDTLKIDRSFISDVESIESKGKLLESIIQMGHKLDLRIVAEGIETMDQMEICRNYACDTFQGYLFSRPLPYEQLTKYIHNYNKKKQNE